MTNEEIVQKAIEKAKFLPDGIQDLPFERMKINVREYRICFSLILDDKNATEKPLIESSIYGVLFSHKFAKAFFGIEWEDGDVIETPMSEILEGENILPWQHHIAKMVLEEEPIKYLEKFL